MESEQLYLCGVLIIVVLVILWLLFNRKKGDKSGGYCAECEMAGPECPHTQPDLSSDEKGLLPVFDPAFNLRECCKQIVLLEDHLINPRKRCKDCCTKHALTIEALAEEAAQLDKDFKYKDVTSQLADAIRDCETSMIKGKDPAKIAQDLRVIRKQLQQQCFDKF